APKTQHDGRTTRHAKSTPWAPTRLNMTWNRAARILTRRLPFLDQLQNRREVLRLHKYKPIGGVRASIPKQCTAVHARDRDRIGQARRRKEALVLGLRETLLPMRLLLTSHESGVQVLGRHALPGKWRWHGGKRLRRRSLLPRHF